VVIRLIIITVFAQKVLARANFLAAIGLLDSTRSTTLLKPLPLPLACIHSFLTLLMGMRRRTVLWSKHYIIHKTGIEILCCMLKILYAACPCLSQSISAQFALEMCLAARSPKNPLKAYFGVQGHPRSLISAPIESQCTISY